MPKWQKKMPNVVQKVTEVHCLLEVKKEESNETAKKPSQEVKPASKGEKNGSQTSEKTHSLCEFLEQGCQLFKAQNIYVIFQICLSHRRQLRYLDFSEVLPGLLNINTNFLQLYAPYNTLINHIVKWA